MCVSVYSVKESRLCTLVLDEGLGFFVVVAKGIGACFKHLAKVNACNVAAINNAIFSTHAGTLELNVGPFVKVPLFEPLP